MAGNRYRKLARHPGKGIEKLLGELELAVMEVVWAQPSATVREVLEVLSKERSLAYTTVMTVMSRLTEKGLLVANKEGRAYRYRAALSRKEMEAQAVGRLLQSLLVDFDGETAVSQFVEQLAAVDPGQLARLAEMAQRAQERQDEA